MYGPPQVPAPCPADPSPTASLRLIDSFEEHASSAKSLFGIVVNPLGSDIEWIESYARSNSKLRIGLIVYLLPGCPTSSADLSEVGRSFRKHGALLRVNVSSTDNLRWRPFLCMVHGEAGGGFLASSCPGTGVGSIRSLPADPTLVTSLATEFRECWADAVDIGIREVQDVPVAFLERGGQPYGTVWEQYSRSVAAAAADRSRAKSISERIDPLSYLEGVSVDGMAWKLSGLYRKGTLVTVDWRKRLSPFDLPVTWKMLVGIPRSLQAGLKPRTSARVSPFAAEELHRLEACRQGLTVLFAKYTFPLGQGLRWVPDVVRLQFEREWQRVNDKGRSLLEGLLPAVGGVSFFLGDRRKKTAADLEAACHSMFGEDAVVSPFALSEVMSVLEKRIERALEGPITPRVTYSPIGFSQTEEKGSPSWGQARRLLEGIATCARRAIPPAVPQSPSMYEREDERSDAEDLAKAMCVLGDPWVATRTDASYLADCEKALRRIDMISKSKAPEYEKCERLLHLLEATDAKTREATRGETFSFD
jgi:hypothetical protein